MKSSKAMDKKTNILYKSFIHNIKAGCGLLRQLYNNISLKHSNK